MRRSTLDGVHRYYTRKKAKIEGLVKKLSIFMQVVHHGNKKMHIIVQKKKVLSVFDPHPRTGRAVPLAENGAVRAENRR